MIAQKKVASGLLPHKLSLLIPIGVSLVLFSGASQSQSVGCGPEQYDSSYTGRCEPVVLQIGVGEQVQSVTLSELEGRFQFVEMTVPQNPGYKKGGTDSVPRAYRGIRLAQLVRALLPAGESLTSFMIAITSLDGFDPVLSAQTIEKMDQLGALLAVEQTSKGSAERTRDGKWDLLDLAWGKVSPGPFYVVWNQAKGTTPMEWPFQIKSLRLIRTADYEATLAKLRPDDKFMGLKPKSDIELGFDQFRGKCLTCHQVGGAGGKKAGIDLKALIQGFQSDSDSLEFIQYVIQNPPDGMIDIKDIKMSESDLRHINAYLRHLVSKVPGSFL